MARKKNNSQLWFILIGLVVLSGIGLFISQSFSVTDLSSQVVYTPIFSNTECAVIDSDNTEIYDWTEREDNNGWITEFCSRNNHEVYTKRCELEVTREEQGNFDYEAYMDEFYICPVGTNFDDKEEKCRELNGVFGTFSFTNQEFILAHAKDSLFGSGEVDENELTIKKVANWYGLKNIDSNNYLSKEVTCDVSRITDNGKTILKSEVEKKAPNGILDFNQVINYISAQTPTISKNVINYKGRDVWTVGNGQACEIEEDVNGIRFVNINTCFQATDIICNPALPFCSDDGTRYLETVSGEEKSCNEIYGGTLNQFVPSSKSGEVCRQSCSGGELSSYDCKKIPSCNIGTLNKDYKCVTANVPQDNGKINTFNPTIMFIILGFIVVILLLMAVKMKQSKGGKKSGGLSF